ncbi:hypothetical protein PTSG_04368 [Salpingoeca rosetta]|uniref:Trimethylguanosine synthase n=1 Tax=Salpingoeca rosetta (strain ATCC 50818 / BSB-021) TaxID=946362 RepID=F2U8C5_SALR5|nr:uncharacterized protein PTSG_04368 [Salpingoeca rosetta]EGD72633.1 hypothetical protein PTSG_04368 [Salpingoeca rosetta]|eukprot:XP_004994456.1 hypothetical protein PTSG_04368 [Salpingoeca rosetta]
MDDRQRHRSHDREYRGLLPPPHSASSKRSYEDRAASDRRYDNNRGYRPRHHERVSSTPPSCARHAPHATPTLSSSSRSAAPLPRSAIRNHGKLGYFFRGLDPSIRRNLVLDNEALYSVSESGSADAMTWVLRCFVGEDEPVLDGTACVGGNTYSLQKVFPHTYATEIDADRFVMLQHNLHVLGCADRVRARQGDIVKFVQDVPADSGRTAPTHRHHQQQRQHQREQQQQHTHPTAAMTPSTTGGDLRSLIERRRAHTNDHEEGSEDDTLPRKRAHRETETATAEETAQATADTTAETRTLARDKHGWPTYFGAIMVDPPWGGVDYRDKRCMDLSLSEVYLERWVRMAASRARVVMCKVPSNYNSNAFNEEMVNMALRADPGPRPRAIVHIELAKFDVIVVLFDHTSDITPGMPASWSQPVAVPHIDDLKRRLGALYPSWTGTIAGIVVKELGWVRGWVSTQDTVSNDGVRRLRSRK